jgi:hypothetical protein
MALSLYACTASIVTASCGHTVLKTSSEASSSGSATQAVISSTEEHYVGLADVSHLVLR